jgi:cyanate permease
VSAPPRRVWLVTAIVALSLNLCLATSTIAPLLPTIRRDTGLSASTVGLLATIPLICFGALAPLAPRLARRFGAHSAQAERPFRRKPNTDSAPSRTPRSEATRLLC